MAGELVQRVVIRIRGDKLEVIPQLAADLNKAGQAAKGLGQSGSDGLEEVTSKAKSLAMELAALVGVTLSVRSALEAIGAGIQKADVLRDVEASLAAVSKSHEEAGRALAFFEEAQKRTRVTGDDLARFYRDQFPLAMRAGFSPENFRKMVVDVTQFATAIGRPIQAIQEEFQHLLSGRIRAQNSDILAALGLGPKDLELGKITLQGVIKGMQEVTARAGDMGQSFESMKAKVKDALLDAFANGFNRARGDAEKGMAGVLKAIDNPEFLGAISKIGELTARMFGPLAKHIEAIVEEFDLLVRHIESKKGVFNRVKDFLQDLTGLGPGLSQAKAPRWGSAPGSEFDLITADTEKLVASIKGLKNTIINPEVDAFNNALGALVMTGKDVDRQLRVMEAAIKIVDQRLGEGRGIQAFRAQLEALRVQAANVGKDLPNNLLAPLTVKLGALGDLINKAFNVPGGGIGITAKEIEAEKKFIEEQRLMTQEMMEEVEEALQKKRIQDIQALRQIMWDSFNVPIINAITDAALTGGKNFGTIVGQMLEETIHGQ